MQQTMRVKLLPLIWTQPTMNELKFNTTDWHEIADIDGNGRFKFKGKEDQGFHRNNYFTTPEPVPTPCPADWQPAPGHSVDHYEAECINNESVLNSITVGEIYQICDMTNNNDFVIIDDKCEREVRRKNRFDTPTLRAEFRDKPEVWQCNIKVAAMPETNPETNPDPVNHPTHYTDGGIETIDFIEAKGLDYYTGNAVKYISRAGKKDASKEMQDLEKAVWYLSRKINRLKNMQDGEKDI